MSAPDVRPGWETIYHFVSKLEALAPQRREGSQQPETAVQRKRKEDRGSLARLRRAAGGGLAEADPQTWRLFYQLAEAAGVPAWAEEDYFLVATLFPFAPARATGNLGACLRRMRDASRALVDDRGNHPLDRQVIALLDADRDELAFRLRQLILRLEQAGVSVDWRRLLPDLQDWSSPDRSVQKRWAHSYWRGESPASNTTNTDLEEKNDAD